MRLSDALQGQSPHITKDNAASWLIAITVARFYGLFGLEEEGQGMWDHLIGEMNVPPAPNFDIPTYNEAGEIHSLDYDFEAHARWVLGE